MRLGHLLALASEHVRSESIDASEFPGLAGLYNVRGVPRIVFNRRLHVEGAVPENVFVQNLLRSAV